MSKKKRSILLVYLVASGDAFFLARQQHRIRDREGNEAKAMQENGNGLGESQLLLLLLLLTMTSVTFGPMAHHCPFLARLYSPCWPSLIRLSSCCRCRAFSYFGFLFSSLPFFDVIFKILCLCGCESWSLNLLWVLVQASLFSFSELVPFLRFWSIVGSSVSCLLPTFLSSLIGWSIEFSSVQYVHYIEMIRVQEHTRTDKDKGRLTSINYFV